MPGSGKWQVENKAKCRKEHGGRQLSSLEMGLSIGGLSAVMEQVKNGKDYLRNQKNHEDVREQNGEWQGIQLELESRSEHVECGSSWLSI